MSDIKNRLEYLRGELRGERISYGEIAELQSLIKHIDLSDTELLEAAGVPEHKQNVLEFDTKANALEELYNQPVKSAKKPIVEFEVKWHGIYNDQYFQGCGTSCTEFAECFTGNGDNPREAIREAIEQLASEWETEGLEQRIIKECFTNKRSIPTKPSVPMKSQDSYYYASILVK